jgi:hypothetical protein
MKTYRFVLAFVSLLLVAVNRKTPCVSAWADSLTQNIDGNVTPRTSVLISRLSLHQTDQHFSDLGLSRPLSGAPSRLPFARVRMVCSTC